MKQPLYRILTILLLAMTAPAAASAQMVRNIPEQSQAAEATVSYVVVTKSERKMYLLDANNNILRSYQVALGFTPDGKKEKEGDGKTPEGKYYIDFRNTNSEYYLSLRISYPNPDDVKRAKKAGVSPGGQIFIHGEPPDRNWMFWKYSNKKDWTQGCIAVNNRDMEEIWNLVPKGTPVYIEP